MHRRNTILEAAAFSRQTLLISASPSVKTPEVRISVFSILFLELARDRQIRLAQVTHSRATRRGALIPLANQIPTLEQRPALPIPLASQILFSGQTQDEI